MTSHSAAPLHRLTILEALAAFRTGELSPVDYLEAHLERIAELDGDRESGINCIVDVQADSARLTAQESAAKYEAARAAGAGWRPGEAPDLAGILAEDHGFPGGPGTPEPLLGIPLLVKEQHNVRGLSATRGSQARQGQVGADDHPVVARLRAAGAIPFGRTTTPEFSCATFTQTREWGVTRNPFNLDKTPGGSSGGSGAAIAAGFAPLATASDIAGSTRLPACFNGVVGYKTPYGRTPAVQPFNADWYRGDHVLARSVADTAYATNIIMGIHPQDPTTTDPNPVLDWRACLEGTVGAPSRRGRRDLPGGGADGSDAAEGGHGLAGLRVGVSPDLGAYAVDPAVAVNLQRVVEVLRDAGATVDEVSVDLSLEDIANASTTHWGYLMSGNMLAGAGGPDHESELEPYTQNILRLGREYAERFSLFDSVAIEAKVQNALIGALAGYDVLLTPTSAVQDLDAGNQYLDGIDRPDGRHAFYWEAHMTIPFNIANRCPVIAVPSGVGENGVPTGVQIAGHPYQDQSVFPVAAALQGLMEWPTPEIF